MAGQAQVGGGEIELAGWVCGSLLYFRRDLTSGDEECLRRARSVCAGAVNGAMFAMQALAHEAYHAMGVAEESTTDCHALQAVSFIATQLRGDAGLGQAVGRYYAANYDQLRGAPGEYRLTEQCRDGGALDYRPESSWPG